MSKTIGNKIKQLREAASLPIGDLAQAAGTSASKMESIESGEIVPSISVLIRIARAMGVRLGTILDGVESTEPTVVSCNCSKPTISTSGKAVMGGHLDFFSLGEQKSDRNMEPFIVDVKYTAKDSGIWSEHEGEEFIYVLEGDIEIFYGSGKYELHKGDSIYYDSIVPHLVTTPAEGAEAKILAVTYTPY